MEENSNIFFSQRIIKINVFFKMLRNNVFQFENLLILSVFENIFFNIFSIVCFPQLESQSRLMAINYN